MILSVKKACVALLLLLVMIFVISPIQAQSGKLDEKEFLKHQDSLKRFADAIVQGREPEQRFRADSFFVRMLVRTLKINNSFYFPFDSLETISKLYSPDSVFRIFTWQLKKDEMVYLQRGAIQMRTPDGSLKLIPLHDASMFTNKPMDSLRGPNNWIGAIYYRIILKQANTKKIYTLLGFDDFSISSNKKWMEILSFNQNGDPVFGGPYISFKEDSAKSPKRPFYRFGIEYKKEASTTFNFNPEMDMIVYDQLISESEEPARKDTFVPDGDFEGFKWKDGMWVHVPQVFNVKLEDGQFPQEQKILDDAGRPDEQKLLEQSEKNQKKAKPAPKK